jgi:hypothetical protein
MAADAREFAQMKTLHVDCGRTMGGGQWQVLYLVERLKDAVLMAPEGSPLLREARQRGIDARPLSILTLQKLARGSDLVHAHDARAHTLCAAVPGKLVVSRRVAFPVKRGMLSRVKYGRADVFLAVSRYVAMQLERAGVSPEKVRVIYDGIPLVPAASGEGVVALAGKGEEILRGLPLRYITDFWQDLAKARVFVYASEMEGLGSAALAAMSASVPVVASSVGGLPEAVEHERTGILVKNRAADFALALSRLEQSPEIAKEMGRRGRERVEKNFTIDIMVQKTMSAYEEVLG